MSPSHYYYLNPKAGRINQCTWRKRDRQTETETDKQADQNNEDRRNSISHFIQLFSFFVNRMKKTWYNFNHSRNHFSDPILWSKLRSKSANVNGIREKRKHWWDRTHFLLQYGKANHSKTRWVANGERRELLEEMREMGEGNEICE